MLILLDIDGVMVPGASWRRPEIDNDGFPRFSIKATESLQKIISETGATIVLTTSHKFKYELVEWRRIFSRRGICNVSVKRLPDNKLHLSRKEEVVKWISRKGVGKYVIIDDDKSLNGLPAHMKSRLVQTSSTVGLNEEHARQAIRILNSNYMTA